jgi:hypothetical protein
LPAQNLFHFFLAQTSSISLTQTSSFLEQRENRFSFAGTERSFAAEPR